MRSIRSFTGNLRRLFSREIFGRKSVYRIEKLKNSIKKRGKFRCFKYRKK